MNKEYPDHVRIHFELEVDEDGYPPANTETLWAVPTQSGFRIDSVPFFVIGVSLGDVVSARYESGNLFFESVVEYGGHSTVRIVAYDPAEVDDLRTELSSLGCASERSHLPSLVSVDVPSNVDTVRLRQFLEEGRMLERFDFQEAAVWW